MKEKIEQKIKFLEAILRDLKKEYESLEYTTVQIENDFSLEELVYKSQIKVLKQILKEE